MINHGKEKEKQQLQFPLFRSQYPSFAAPNACLDALSSSFAIAKANCNAYAPPTVETQEVDLNPHDPQNPPSPPHASTSSSSGFPTIVTQGGSSESSNASTNNYVADDVQLQGMPSSSSSVQTVSVPKEGTKKKIIRAAEWIVEASTMCCFRIDSSKFIRDPLEQLLPRNMEKAKKMRLLITASDESLRNLFAMRCLPMTDAMGLLKNGLYDETNDREEQTNSSQTKQDSGDMWWNSKTSHCVNNIHMLQRGQTKCLSYSDGRERQIECYFLSSYLPKIITDPFLDICSFLVKHKLELQLKRALVTKDTNFMAKVYESWFPKVQIKLKSFL